VTIRAVVADVPAALPEGLVTPRTVACRVPLFVECVFSCPAPRVVGSHILPQLVAAGLDVTSGSRDPAGAARHHPSRAFVRLDLAAPASVATALAGVDAAVYLVHSMAADKSYAALEESAAHHFRDAAAARGLGRIVYLGGMRPRGEPSRHIASRLRTGEILRSGSVPVVELRATMIIGGGSQSFRIVRDLAARLPFMLLPR
jgi:uncharacterized protein YbjT (DUF2867 family)